MSLLLLGFLLMHICNGVSAKQSGSEVAVESDPKEIMFENDSGIGDQVKELMQRMERMEISWKQEKAHLETKLESQNMEMENNKKRLTEM